MQATERALIAATDLLTTDHALVQALVAHRRGRMTFRPDPLSSLVNVETHLNRIAGQASYAECLCQLADFTELGRLCGRINSEITTALRAGPAGADPRENLIHLTAQGRELLAAADRIPV